MDLSVVILNFNTCDLLRDSIKSIFESTHNIDFEVIVVDNASVDNSCEMVKTEFPNVKLIENKKNTGFSHGNNLGIKETSGEYICLLNPDTVVKENTFEYLIKFMKENPECGISGPKIYFGDGSIQFSFRSFPSFSTALFNRASTLTKLFPKNPFSDAYLMTSTDRDQPGEVDWLSGSCMVVNKKAIDEVGLLDENFFMYAEDVDWCYRMKQKGWKNFYCPSGTIIHYTEQSSKQYPIKSLYERHRSMYYFYKKHYSYHIPLIDIATLAGIIARFIMTSMSTLFNPGKTKKAET